MSMLSTVLHTVESAAIAASLTCKVFEGERGDEKREVSVFPVAVVVERLHPQTKVKTLTWGLASETAYDAAGMMSGTAAATCLGALLDSSPRARSAQTLVVHWHLASVASSRCGTTPRRAAHETADVTIWSTASSAAARTGGRTSGGR